jgi:uncharacterized membrane protein
MISDVPEILVENATLWEPPAVTGGGAGSSVIVAEEDLVWSAVEVAVTITVVCTEIVEGAVNIPEEEMLPIDGLSDQVTLVLLEPETVAVNCWAWPPLRLEVPGVTVTETGVAGGISVTVADEDLVESAAEVAVTLTVVWLEIEEGAVNIPVDEIPPIEGLSDQVTAVLLEPETVAVNCWAWLPLRLEVPGVTVTETGVAGGISVTVADEDLVESAAEVAVTLTVVWLEIEEGAVNIPVDEIPPIDGLSDQVTAVLLEPETVAVNCWAWLPLRLEVPGVTVTETGVAGGISVTVTVADLVESAAEVAVTLTTIWLEMVEGAVNIPVEEMPPIEGLSDQLTDELLEPETVAVNCCVWFALSWTVAGLATTETGGFTVTVALADFVGSVIEVAVMVIVVWLETEAGAA